MLITAVAAAVMAAAADPIARVLIHGTHGASNPAYLARAIALFAPGVIGFALVAHLGRALYAGTIGPVEALADGRIVQVLPDWNFLPNYSGQLWILHPPTRHLPLKLRVLMDFLAERLGGVDGLQFS